MKSGWYRQGSVFDFIEWNECENLQTDIRQFHSFDEAVKYYFQYYRKNGYPNYDLASYIPSEELDKVKRSNDSEIIADGIAKQVMTGCGYLWGYFPHWINVKTYGGESIADGWEDDAKLETLISKTVAWCLDHECGRWSENRIRQNAKVYLAKQSPSNFRPTVAKALYNKYGNGGAVYDPCAGWGGRMFGFMASGCTEYVCCEPSTKTVIGLKNLAKAHGCHNVTINEVCQEEYTPKENYFDMVLTSPPYFDCERYSEEKTQSCIRYSEISKWCAMFLEPLVYNAYKALKNGGHFIINIANTKTAPQLEEMTRVFADMVGFKQKETIMLALSSIAGEGTKYEPMFVFKKGKR